METFVIAALPPSRPWLPLAAPMISSPSEAPRSTSDLDHSGSPATVVSESAGTTLASDWQILVVDDEPGIRTMLRLLLEDEGYIVSEAADGVIGLAQLRASAHPVIVLLDYKMPRMNGAEVLETVMADPRLAGRHAFIFVTANLPAFPATLHQLLLANRIPVVQKPFQFSVILDEIELAIARMRASPDSVPPQR